MTLRDHATELALLYEEGWTYERIAGAYGVTKERVRQVLRMEFGQEWIHEVQAAHREEYFAARRRERADADMAELLERCRQAKPCRVCGAWVIRRMTRGFTCSKECGSIWAVARTALDEDVHRTHRQAVAKTIMRIPGRYQERYIRWAKAILSDDPPPPNRRWTQRGSRVSEALKRAEEIRGQSSP